MPGVGDAIGLLGIGGKWACNIQKCIHITANASSLLKSTYVIGNVVRTNIDRYLINGEKFSWTQFGVDLLTVGLEVLTMKNAAKGLSDSSNIIFNNSYKNDDLSIPQKHTGKGNPNAVLMFGTELNNRQSHLLSELSEYDSRIIVPKNSVNMADLSALTAQTGDEFAMFTNGGNRLVVRGNRTSVNIDTVLASELSSQGYRWSGHTHPGSDMFCLTPSSGDKAVLNAFGQEYSAIYNSKGQFIIFGLD